MKGHSKGLKRKREKVWARLFDEGGKSDSRDSSKFFVLWERNVGFCTIGEIGDSPGPNVKDTYLPAYVSPRWGWPIFSIRCFPFQVDRIPSQTS